jgi:hypothetical protein
MRLLWLLFSPPPVFGGGKGQGRPELILGKKIAIKAQKTY